MSATPRRQTIREGDGRGLGGVSERLAFTYRRKPLQPPGGPMALEQERGTLGGQKASVKAVR